VLRQTALFPFRRHGGFQEKQDSQGRRKPNRNNAESQTATAPKAKPQQRRKPNCNNAESQTATAPNSKKANTHSLALATAPPPGVPSQQADIKNPPGAPESGGDRGGGKDKGPPASDACPPPCPARSVCSTRGARVSPPSSPQNRGLAVPKSGRTSSPQNRGLGGAVSSDLGLEVPEPRAFGGKRQRRPQTLEADLGSAPSSPQNRGLAAPKSGRGVRSRGGYAYARQCPPSFLLENFRSNSAPKDKGGALSGENTRAKNVMGGALASLSLSVS
jgi:hypothetical protein